MAPTPRIVRLYAAAARLRRRWRRGSEAVFDGLFLGLMDRRALAAVDEAFYSATTERVDGEARGYADEAHIRSGLLPWEAAVVERHFPAAGRIVVTGAGGGREVLALAERGYEAVGYEPHPGFVAAGQDVLARSGRDARLLASDRDLFPPLTGQVTAIVVGWGSYMLLPTRARRVAFLEGARRVLPAGAPILVSFFPRRPERVQQVTRVVGSAVRRLRGGEPVELGDSLVPNFVHRFTREEIAGELADAGFDLVEYAEAPYGHAVGRAR